MQKKIGNEVIGKSRDKKTAKMFLNRPIFRQSIRKCSMKKRSRPIHFSDLYRDYSAGAGAFPGNAPEGVKNCCLGGSAKVVILNAIRSRIKY